MDCVLPLPRVHLEHTEEKNRLFRTEEDKNAEGEGGDVVIVGAKKEATFLMQGGKKKRALPAP